MPESPFMPTISYSPAPSRSLPLPRPLGNPISSSPWSPLPSPPSRDAVPLTSLPALRPPVPNVIGRSSLQRHPYVPPATVIIPDTNIVIHQVRLRGRDPVCKKTMMRCMRWRVREKSRISFDRDIRVTNATTLSPFSDQRRFDIWQQRPNIDIGNVRGSRGENRTGTYTAPAQHSHTKAINQPCVLSPRRLAQPKTRSRLNCRPMTSEVKSISTSATL